MSGKGWREGIREAEARRLEKQAALDARLEPAERNRLGQFATPPALAWDLLRVAKRHLPRVERIRFLDPATGTGVFFGALLDIFDPARIEAAVGFEVDEDVARAAQELWHPFGLRVERSDFTQTTAPRTASGKFNLLVCNPPYSRHHHLDSRTKRRLQRLVARNVRVSINGLAGLYCYFVFLADAWLADNGIAVWLLPSEFLDVNYGSALRQYLSTNVSLRRIHRFDPEDVQFADALVTSCVLVYQKTPPCPEHTLTLSHGGSLLRPTHVAQVRAHVLRDTRKWRHLAVDGSARLHTESASASCSVAIGDIFETTRGIVTGANGFFICEREEALERGLPEEFLRPILPSPRHMHDEHIEADQDGWPLLPRTLALLDCDLPRSEIRMRYPRLEEYLREGEATDITSRYLLRNRTPWYRQEVRRPAPILCTYMGRRKRNGKIFRFLRNHSKATAANVYLLLYPRPNLREAERASPGVLDRVFLALQQLSDDECTAEGRTYGGGLTKLEPSELSRLRLALNAGDLGLLSKHGMDDLPLFSAMNMNAAVTRKTRRVPSTK